MQSNQCPVIANSTICFSFAAHEPLPVTDDILERCESFYRKLAIKVCPLGVTTDVTRYIALVLALLLTVLGLMGSLAIIMIFLYDRTLWRVNYVFVFNLFLSDFMFTVITGSHKIHVLATGSALGGDFCFVAGYLGNSLYVVSYLNTFLIAVNRFVQVCCSSTTYNRFFSGWKASLDLLLVWTTGLLWNLGLEITYNSLLPGCIFNFELRATHLRIYIMLCVYVAILIAVFVLYTVLAFKVTRFSRLTKMTISAWYFSKISSLSTMIRSRSEKSSLEQNFERIKSSVKDSSSEAEGETRAKKQESSTAGSSTTTTSSTTSSSSLTSSSFSNDSNEGVLQPTPQIQPAKTAPFYKLLLKFRSPAATPPTPKNISFNALLSSTPSSNTLLNLDQVQKSSSEPETQTPPTPFASDSSGSLTPVSSVTLTPDQPPKPSISLTPDQPPKPSISLTPKQPPKPSVSLTSEQLSKPSTSLAAQPPSKSSISLTPKQPSIPSISLSPRKLSRPSISLMSKRLSKSSVSLNFGQLSRLSMVLKAKQLSKGSIFMHKLSMTGFSLPRYSEQSSELKASSKIRFLCCRMKREHLLILTFYFSVFLLVFYAIPFTCFLSCAISSGGEDSPCICLLWTHQVALLCSTFNFFVYGALNRNIRQAARQLFAKICKSSSKNVDKTPSVSRQRSPLSEVSEKIPTEHLSSNIPSVFLDPGPEIKLPVS